MCKRSSFSFFLPQMIFSKAQKKAILSSSNLLFQKGSKVRAQDYTKKSEDTQVSPEILIQVKNTNTRASKNKHIYKHVWVGKV